MVVLVAEVRRVWDAAAGRWGVAATMRRRWADEAPSELERSRAHGVNLKYVGKKNCCASLSVLGARKQVRLGN